MDRSKIARHRQSLTPEGERQLRESVKREGGKLGKKNASPPRRKVKDGSDQKWERRGPMPPSKLRERSLSPFSKRVALTQAMNAGRIS
jgi:hypothetical protein